MATVRLDISYDGAGFSGWAAQPGLRTVQGELETALATILREEVSLTVAGRTDAGVHAWGQVASFEAAANPGPGLARRLNGVGPGDVAVIAAAPAPDGFDARRDARSRTYCYRVLAREAPSPFERGGRCGGRIASIRPRSMTAPSRSSAITTSPPSPRPRPTTCASSAVCSRRSGAGRATSCRSGSRPMPSCATWCGCWSARCSRSPGAGARSPSSRVSSRRAAQRSRRDRTRARPLPRLGLLLTPAPLRALGHPRPPHPAG